MTDFVMHSMADANRLFGLLQAQDFTRPKKIVIKDQDRSGEQNKKLHACLSDIAKQVEHAGKKWDVLIWKRLLTAAWLREAGERPQMISTSATAARSRYARRRSKRAQITCVRLRPFSMSGFACVTPIFPV